MRDGASVFLFPSDGVVPCLSVRWAENAMVRASIRVGCWRRAGTGGSQMPMDLVYFLFPLGCLATHTDALQYPSTLVPAVTVAHSRLFVHMIIAKGIERGGSVESALKTAVLCFSLRAAGGRRIAMMLGGRFRCCFLEDLLELHFASRHRTI